MTGNFGFVASPGIGSAKRDVRLKDIAKISAGVPAPTEGFADPASGTPFLRVSDLAYAVDSICNQSADSFSVGLKTWKKGTIVFPKSGESIRTNARARLGRPMSVVSHLACLNERSGILNDFLYWLTCGVDFSNDIDQTALPALSLERIKNTKVVLHDLSQQIAIADYLDRTTALIDKQRALLERKKALLQEHKKALIHEAVTKGLTPGVAMKPSGMDWIGDVPAGWMVVRGKDILVKNRIAPKEGDEVVTCFRDGEVIERRLRRSAGFTFAMQEHGYQGVRVGHLVIHGMDAFAGAIGISKSDGKCSPVYAVCSSRMNSVHLTYVSYFLRYLAGSGYIQSVAKGIRERSTEFRFSEISEANYCLPTLSEQVQIARFIDSSSEIIDRQLSAIVRKIKALAELRQSVIQETVTQGVPA